jgi:hypothetical protein
LGWRNIYWLCFALHAAAVPILMFFYHPMNQYVSEAGKSRWDQVKSLDYIGSGLFCIGVCLFLIGLSFGGTKYPWYVCYNSRLSHIISLLPTSRS